MVSLALEVEQQMTDFTVVVNSNKKLPKTKHRKLNLQPYNEGPLLLTGQGQAGCHQG